MLLMIAGPKKRPRCSSPEYKRFDTTVKPSAIRTDRQKERRASQRKGEAAFLTCLGLQLSTGWRALCHALALG